MNYVPKAPSLAPFTPGWSDELVKELLVLVRQGDSASEMARKLKKTKNSVIGKCHRLGISLTETTRKIPLDAMLPARARVKIKPKLTTEAKPATPPKLHLVVADHLPRAYAEPTKPAPTGSVRLTELPFGSCKYPTARDAEGEWLMCAKKRKTGSIAYCQEHHDICHQPSYYRGRK